MKINLDFLENNISNMVNTVDKYLELKKYLRETKNHFVSSLNKQKDNLLIGYDINFNHNKWQDESSLKNHQLIIGENIFEKYDMFLAKQAISNNMSVWLCNINKDDIDEIINLSKKENREHQIRIFHLSNELQYAKYSNFLVESDELVRDSKICLFDKEGINSQNILDGNYINIFYFSDLFNTKEYHLLIMSYIKNAIESLIENTPEYLIPTQDSLVKLIFMRNMYLNNIAVTPYQAKAWNFSLNYSYPSIAEMKGKLGNNLMTSIIANTDTKILSEQAKKDIRLISKQDIKNDLSLVKNYEKEVIWLWKKNAVYQIQF